MRILGIFLGIMFVFVLDKGLEELDAQTLEQSIVQHPKDGGNPCRHNPPRLDDVPCSLIHKDTVVLYNEHGIRTTITR